MNSKVPIPPFEKSEFIIGAEVSEPVHDGVGDMWPVTWAADDAIYAGAGDNDPGEGEGTGFRGNPHWSPMNLWCVRDNPSPHVTPELVHNLPVDPKKYAQRPRTDLDNGIKPAALLSIGGVLYMAVENISDVKNMAEHPDFNRQENLNGWIITSHDFGKTWNVEATPQEFFVGRLSSPHFVQFGRDYAGAPDEYVYVLFPGTDDGYSFWDDGDYMLLGRVPKMDILCREKWEFWTRLDPAGQPQWSTDDAMATAVFRYPHFAAENHVSYNAGLRRYIMGNGGFYHPDDGRPFPYHNKPRGTYKSQLTLYEAENLWGPWRLFYRDDWGKGNYQPAFPTKWMNKDGREMVMVSSGMAEHYTFTTQTVRVKTKSEV